MKIRSGSTPLNFIFGERYTIEVEGASSPSVFSLEKIVETVGDFEYHLVKVK